jgi:hypothetical protein
LDTLNRVFVDTPEALGRKARLNTWYRAKDEKLLVPPPMSREEVSIFNTSFVSFASLN